MISTYKKHLDVDSVSSTPVCSPTPRHRLTLPLFFLTPAGLPTGLTQANCSSNGWFSSPRPSGLAPEDGASHLLPRHWSFGHPAVSCVPLLVPVLVPAATTTKHTTLKHNNRFKSAGLQEQVLTDRQWLCSTLNTDGRCDFCLVNSTQEYCFLRLVSTFFCGSMQVYASPFSYESIS